MKSTLHVTSAIQEKSGRTTAGWLSKPHCVCGVELLLLLDGWMVISSGELPWEFNSHIVFTVFWGDRRCRLASPGWKQDHEFQAAVDLQIGRQKLFCSLCKYMSGIAACCEKKRILFFFVRQVAPQKATVFIWNKNRLSCSSTKPFMTIIFCIQNDEFCVDWCHSSFSWPPVLIRFISPEMSHSRKTKCPIVDTVLKWYSFNHQKWVEACHA